MAHAAVATVLGEGMQAIDATVGNGHDTLFLARQVGATGHVYGFDVQQAALDASAARLRAEGVADRASLIHAGHETMARQLPATLRGKVQAIMFNLGYLPGSDRGCITRATSTLPALEQSLALLAPQGVLSLLAYRGHAGGQDEAATVTRWLLGLDAEHYRVHRFGSETGNQTGPELSLVYRCLDP
jgi:predicted methyltransferase